MSTISTLSEVRPFRFDGSACLYRDPFGRRVVADFEGSGEYRVEAAEAPLQILRDEEKTDAFRGSFAKSLSVLALSPGKVQISVARDLLPLNGPFIETDRFEGAGWVAWAEGPLVLDGELCEISPSRERPYPFFHAASGSDMHIAPVPFRAICVDRWRIDDLIALKSRGWQVQNVSKVIELEAACSHGTSHRAPVACHLNVASWRCPVPPENGGIRLRKTYDRFHGRQRARVFIDGELAGWWYEPKEDRTRRWGVAEFGVPAALTAGKDQIQITIDPPAGSPLWSVSEFEVYALLSNREAV